MLLTAHRWPWNGQGWRVTDHRNILPFWKWGMSRTEREMKKKKSIDWTATQHYLVTVRFVIIEARSEVTNHTYSVPISPKVTLKQCLPNSITIMQGSNLLGVQWSLQSINTLLQYCIGNMFRLTITTEPLGILYPELVTSQASSRVVPLTGGYSRMVSLNTC